jgi:phage-related minor tail protein
VRRKANWTKQKQIGYVKVARSAAEDALKGAEQNFSSSFASMRELNIKLIDMAHANADAVFDLAHEVANAQAPRPLVR